ncbi:MAG: hypothetical protein WCI47_01475 [bacterium]
MNLTRRNTSRIPRQIQIGSRLYRLPPTSSIVGVQIIMIILGAFLVLRFIQIRRTFSRLAQVAPVTQEIKQDVPVAVEVTLTPTPTPPPPTATPKPLPRKVINMQVNRRMLFLNTPGSIAESNELASEIVDQLKRVVAGGEQPVVILEPSTSSGQVNFEQYKNGAYDQYLLAMFNQIKALGVNDASLGLWVSFPESNTPEWSQNNPDAISAGIAKTATLQKQVFPASLAGVMFESKTYPAGSKSWDNGSYVSYLPYIRTIPKGLIDSFGVQGFPWGIPAYDGGGGITDPQVFLPRNLAIEGAQFLGANSIWYNTGTYKRMFTDDPSATVSLDANQRNQILDGIASVANSTKAAGYSVFVNIFAEDKSNVGEAIDWSYAPGSADAAALEDFKVKLRQSGIGLSLFTK